MTRMPIKILGVSEKWWNGKYSKRWFLHRILRKLHHKRCRYYRRPKFSPNGTECLSDFNRLRLLKIKSSCQDICTIQCYAPTNEKDYSEIETSYENVEAAVRKTEHNETVFILGDFKAKVGSMKSLVFMVFATGTREVTDQLNGENPTTCANATHCSRNQTTHNGPEAQMGTPEITSIS